MQQLFDINNTSLVIARLKRGETVKEFDCGDSDLNDFILNESNLYLKEKLAVTYVLEDETDTEHKHVAAFFSLSNDRISISDFDTRTKYNRFIRRFNNHNLHTNKYAQHSIQRSDDIDNIYQSDTTIINQDALLIRKNNDISSAKMKLILWGLIALVIVIFAILVRMIIVRYRRNERERIDIELRERLEREVARQTRQLVQQKNEISNRNNDILLSQSYARVIQEGVLPDISKFTYPEFSGSFIIYKPADVVSSNLYWYRRFGQNIVVCCADCIETGVPGAMITMVALTILSDITHHRQSYIASEIINDFNMALVRMMSDINRRNSMGMSVVVVDTQKHRLNVAASNNKVAMYIDKQMHYVQGDECYLGVAGEENEQTLFTDTFINYASGDSVYLFTDGVNSLLSGMLGEKLTEKRFNEILMRSVGISIENRGKQIEKWLQEWTRDKVQKNDISIIGFELL